MLGTENDKLIEAIARFGKDLGMFSQIANDIFGITRGNDIQKRKLNLPVAYALTQTKGEVKRQLKMAFYKPSTTRHDTAIIKNILFNCGAMYYTMVEMETHKQDALIVLDEAKKEGAKVEWLSLFIDM
jgi:geranylgeranyl pyrophosphate synthase